jgi:hypothetical protein
MNRHFAAGPVDRHRRAIERRPKSKPRRCSSDSVAAAFSQQKIRLRRSRIFICRMMWL